jgi:hypothetical protein
VQWRPKIAAVARPTVIAAAVDKDSYDPEASPERLLFPKTGGIDFTGFAVESRLS